MKISGWGRYPVVEADVVTPATCSAASGFLRNGGNDALIPRGLGRSYGDSALASRILSTTALNFILDFDDGAGRICCSAGASLDDMLNVLLPRGWFLPVTPGTRFVSVGGAIASDVHGKNHHLSGCFSDHVETLKVMVASGETVTCSRTEHADLFHATCGGMGLTGIILEATIRLRPVRSAYVEQTLYKARDLTDVLALLAAHKSSTYSVAWVDALAAGRSFGRSLLLLGEHADEGALTAGRSRSGFSVPATAPEALLSRSSVRLCNALYYGRALRRCTHRRVHYGSFFYPLDGIRQWNRLYGARGFTQYQFVLPTAAGPEGIRAILERIAASRRGSFLTVLKQFGPANDNYLSFPMEGCTLAVDFKLESSLFPFLDELDAMVLDYGGRLYLAKDSRMSESTFKRSYPRWEQFEVVRERYGAAARFASCQSRRLGLASP